MYLASSFLLGENLKALLMWELPKIRSPNIDPKTVYSSSKDTHKTGPPIYRNSRVIFAVLHEGAAHSLLAFVRLLREAASTGLLGPNMAEFRNIP